MDHQVGPCPSLQVLALGPWQVAFILWTSVFSSLGEASCLSALTIYGSVFRAFYFCRRLRVWMVREVSGDLGRRVSRSTLRNEYTMNGNGGFYYSKYILV